MKAQKIFFLLFLTVPILCFGNDQTYINAVYNGVLKGFKTTTLGKAFDGSFDNPEWRYFESAKGQKVVTFTGNISKNLHEFGVNKHEFFVLKYAIVSADPLAKEMTEEEKLFHAQQLNDSVVQQHIVPDFLEGKKPELTIFFNKLKSEFWKIGDSVEFQFVLSVDGKSFEFWYYDKKPFDHLTNLEEDILPAIYN